MAASTGLDDPVKTLIESINPNDPRLQAVRILDYCNIEGEDLKTKLEACNTGTMHFMLYLPMRVIFRVAEISELQRSWLPSRVRCSVLHVGVLSQLLFRSHVLLVIIVVDQ